MFSAIKSLIASAAVFLSIQFLPPTAFAFGGNDLKHLTSVECGEVPFPGETQIRNVALVATIDPPYDATASSQKSDLVGVVTDIRLTGGQAMTPKKIACSRGTLPGLSCVSDNILISLQAPKAQTFPGATQLDAVNGTITLIETLNDVNYSLSRDNLYCLYSSN